MPGVLVVGARDPHHDIQATNRLLAVARELDGSVTLVVLGELADEAAEAVAADEVLVIECATVQRGASVAAAAVASLVADQRPSAVLGVHGLDAMGWAPAVAATLGLGFAADAVALRRSADGIICDREVYGGDVMAAVDFPGAQTVVLLVRDGRRTAAAWTGPPPVVTRITPGSELKTGPETVQVALDPPDAAEGDLALADVICAVGRGATHAAGLARFRAVADRLGAQLAVSRPMVDAGTASKTLLVGQSGCTVNPRLYLAFGISGAPQHLAGIQSSTIVVAVNSDPTAPIFRRADFGCSLDLFAVVDELETIAADA